MINAVKQSVHRCQGVGEDERNHKGAARIGYELGGSIG
jgi:hypothetical protein